MRQNLLAILAFLCLVGAQTYAQNRTVTGKVSDSDGPIPGVSVLIKGQKTGTQTKGDGTFSISAAPGAQLTISFIGYETKEVTVGTSGEPLLITLSVDAKTLSEVVVTGVAQATSQAKLPFALTKVSAEKLNTVPALDLSQSLRSKVAGIQISQGEGDDAATVLLRGAKAISRTVTPLIVVDGYVTSLTLGDLNPSDVESIEVVKGAAASALYGTRAEGGVIQVISKKGKNTPGGFKVTVENEYGQNNIQRLPALANQHMYKTNDADTYGFAYAVTSAGVVTTSRIVDYQANGFSVNLHPYKTYYDNTGNLLGDNPYYRNAVNMAASGDKYNSYLSFENQVTGGGLVDLIDPNIRRAAKLNLQLRPIKKLELETNFHYFYNEKPSSAISSNGQGTFFAATLQYEPFIDLAAKNSAGNYNVTPNGQLIQGANLTNPLYEWSKRQYHNNSDELLVGGKARYRFSSKLTGEVLGSVDKYNYTSSDLYPKGYETQSASATLNSGNLSLSYSSSQFVNTQASLSYNDKIGDFTLGATLKMAYEYNYSKGFGVSGYNFTVPLYTIGNTQAAVRSGSGSDDFTSKTVNYGYYFNPQVSYNDKYFLDVLLRVDRSSRFGADEQNAYFPRIATAYRITEDFDLGAITQLKARASWGAAGSLPGYGQKESRATVSTTGLAINQNENTSLKRSITTELELGFDATLMNRVNIQMNYAAQVSKNDFVQPPSFYPWLGGSIYKNFGKVTNKSIELEANGTVYQRKNISWDAGLTFARTRSKIVELGEGLPSFVSGLFYKSPGLSPFAMYGHHALRSLSELEVSPTTGLVTNAAGGLYSLDKFDVNSKGFVVLKSSIGTSAEAPLLLQQGGSSKSVIIGDTQSDFQVGFNTSVSLFKRFSIYGSLDWRQGGDKYNNTNQYLTFDARSAIWQDYAQSGLPTTFIQGLYNGNSYTDFWVEDNTYLSLRELSVSYDVPKFKSLKVLKNARISFTGRNLYTWTKYTGVNPEASSEYFPYPVYRTFTGKLTLGL